MGIQKEKSEQPAKIKPPFSNDKKDKLKNVSLLGMCMPAETAERQYIAVAIPRTQLSLLSPEITCLSHSDGTAYNIVDYFKHAREVGARMTLLAELAAGFYDKGADGYANPDMRRNIRETYRGRGEWTGDFPNYDVPTPHGRVIPTGYIGALWTVLPDDVQASPKGDGSLIVEGGRSEFVELPPAGLRVPDNEGRIFHSFAGSALRTLPFDKRKQAEKEMERWGYDPQDLSRWYRGEPGYDTRAVGRAFWSAGYGPFYANASRRAGVRDPNLGVASRLEPARSAGDAAGNVVVVPMEKYARLVAIAERLEHLKEEINRRV